MYSPKKIKQNGLKWVWKQVCFSAVQEAKLNWEVYHSGLQTDRLRSCDFFLFFFFFFFHAYAQDFLFMHEVNFTQVGNESETE